MPRWRRAFPLFCLVLAVAQVGSYRYAEAWLQGSLGVSEIASIVVPGLVYLGMWAIVVLVFLVSEHRQHRRAEPGAAADRAGTS